jgi:hypothetical protein
MQALVNATPDSWWNPETAILVSGGGIERPGALSLATSSRDVEAHVRGCPHGHTHAHTHARTHARKENVQLGGRKANVDKFKPGVKAIIMQFSDQDLGHTFVYPWHAHFKASGGRGAGERAGSTVSQQHARVRMCALARPTAALCAVGALLISGSAPTRL